MASPASRAAVGKEEKISSAKLTVVQYIILGIFLLLVAGFWRLQVVGSERYESLAEQNRIHKVPILAPRGKILDREGRIIVDNRPSTSAFILREQIKDPAVDLPLIARGLGMTVPDIEARLHRYVSAAKFDPIPLKDDISEDENEFIESHRDELPELETVSVSRRLYPRNGFAGHLIGYVGEVSEDMLNQPQYELRQPGDVVGRFGVEEQYNDLLMGVNGSRLALVNSHGKEVGRIGTEPAKPGQQLKLTIDLDLQIAAEQAMQGRNGGLVALDPRNGEVLAMVSRPSFDPNDFAVRVSRQEWAQLLSDDAKPLMNKAIQAQLAPGSTFKIIMSVAGLQEGIAQKLRVNCPGGATFYGRYFKCWVTEEHRVHGEVDISKAIYQSCDVFFYTLAERLGIERIAQYAHALGLGQKTGIDLPQEVSGVMPSEEWKLKNFHEKWFAGETISVGIGQGAVTVTPIQLARAIGGIASGGVLYRPHVVFPDELPEQYKQVQYAQPDRVQVPLDPQNWTIITDAMAEVVNPIGTAPSAHLQGIDFAGKTGSAQVVSNAARARLSGKQYRDNSWFVGFAPRRNPEIVVAMLYEQGEHGKLAARLVAQVIKTYVEKQRRKDHNLLADEKPKAQTASLSGRDKGKQAKSDSIEMAAFWSDADDVSLKHADQAQDAVGEDQHLGAGVFRMPVRSPHPTHPAPKMRVSALSSDAQPKPPVAPMQRAD